MPSKQDSSIAFTADVSQFTQNINKMKDDIKLINSQFEASASKLDDWSTSSEGLEAKIKQLNSVLEDEKNKLSSMEKKREEYISTLEKNKKALSDLEKEYQEVVATEGESSKKAQKLAKDKAKLATAITSNENAITRESTTINKQTAVVNNTSKALKGYQEELENVGKEAKDSEKKVEDFNDASSGLKSALSGIGKGVASGIKAIGLAAAGAVASFFALAESTREYRKELGMLETVSDSMGANFEETKKAYQDLVAVTNDEGAATEAINNLLSAGFKGDELDEINQYLQGAAIKWKDTLKAEGLADSLQEWIGSSGESLTGNFAEMLERLGYNLETVKLETAGFTDEQRRAYAMDLMAKEGLDEVSAAYKEQNKDLYEASIAQQNLTDKMAGLGAIAEPLVTIFKDKLAQGIEAITPLIKQLANAFELLLSDNKMTGLQRLADIFMNIKEKINNAIIDIMNGLTELIPQLLPKVAEMLGQIIQKFVEFTPTLVNAAIQLFGAIVQALPPTIIVLLEQLPQILDEIITALNEMIPALLEAALSFFGTLLEALPSIIQKIAIILPQLLTAITNFFTENAPIIFEKFVEFLGMIVEAIPVIIQSLADALPSIIGCIVDFAITNLPKILEMGINLFNQIIAAIPVLIVNLQKQLPTIISKIVRTLLANAPKIFLMAIDLFMNIVSAIPKMIIELVKTLPEITSTILDAFKDAPTMLLEVGKDIVRGLWEGIESMGDWLWEKVTGFFDNVEGWAKDVLGIASQSTVFAEMGGYSAEGYGNGFDEKMKAVKKDIEDSLNFSNGDVNLGTIRANNSTNGNGEGSGKVVNLTYVVNSPKQLNRFEIYQQAKKMKAMYTV